MRAQRCWSFPSSPAGSKGRRLPKGPRAAAIRSIAVRASRQGPSLVFDAIGFSVERAGDPLGSQSARGLPINFAGAPVFNARGGLAGLLVGPSGHDIALVPAARLQKISMRQASLQMRQ
jgi:hypothetical protein